MADAMGNFQPPLPRLNNAARAGDDVAPKSIRSIPSIQSINNAARTGDDGGAGPRIGDPDAPGPRMDEGENPRSAIGDW